jgi:hypothetical protein
MSNLFRRPIARLLDTAQRRFRAARPGSVLIFVVVVLVLLALIATAFLSTARVDRYGAAQHSANIQIEMLIEGVINLAVGNITDDLYGTTPDPTFGNAEPYRPPGDPAVTGYEHYDAFASDWWVAPRTPMLPNMAVAPSATPAPNVKPNTTPNAPMWRTLSWPLTPRDDGTYWFDSPDVAYDSIPLALTGGSTRKDEYAFFPGHGTIGAANAQPWPFIQIVRPNGPAITGDDFIPGADADGDGIADSGLWKLPVGTINGITYYAGARIIDNNSAINVNTALARSADFQGDESIAFNVGNHLSGVALAEILRTFDNTLAGFWGANTGPGNANSEINGLSAFRFNIGAVHRPPAGVTGSTIGGDPYDDGGTARTEYDFATVGDAIYQQLARRLAFPGRATDTNPYQAFSIGDSMALAYRGGVLRNPIASASILEEKLNQSLFFTAGGTAVRTSAYLPSEIAQWYDQNFRTEAEVLLPTLNTATFRQRRTLLTARNPVANQIPAFYDTLDLNGDTVRNDMPATMPVVGSATRPVATSMPAYLTGSSVFQGARPTPPKTSVNTADFAELWRAFWSVMADADGGTPFDDAIAAALAVDATAIDPYVGMAFDVQATTQAATQTSTQPTSQPFFVIDDPNPARMFRSPLRDPRYAYGVSLSPYETMLLRSALAAVNAEDLRDIDLDVTAREIGLRAMIDGTEQTVQVVVYGTEPQPYITEVYAQTDTAETLGGLVNPNENGYMAIELHNPYPFDIELTNWRIGVINRDPDEVTTTYATSGLEIEELANFSDASTLEVDPGTGGVGPIKVPAHGYLLIENYNTNGGGSAKHRPRSSGLPPTGPIAGETAGNAAYDPAGPRPTATPDPLPQLNRVYVRNLMGGGGTQPGAANREIVLLRPRLYSGASDAGTYPSSATWNDQAATVAPNLGDFIPVDSFDFTGLKYASGASTQPSTQPGSTTRPSGLMALHYARANQAATQPSQPGGDVSKAWHHVYPGRYDAAQVFRHQGTNFAYWSVPDGDPWATTQPTSQPSTQPSSTTQPAITLGTDKLDTNTPTSNGNRQASYPVSFPIQLANTHWGGVPNPLLAYAPAATPPGALPNPARFPFGSFGRNGDMLQVPFIGAYRVKTQAIMADPNAVLELNAVTIDSAFAEDTDISDDTLVTDTGIEDREQVGRFVPLREPEPTGTQPYINDLVEGGTYDDLILDATNRVKYRYRWASDLFDYLTVQAPHDDYTPNVARPSITPTNVANAEATPNAGGAAGNRTDTDDTNNHREDAAAVEGLININTAPWKVLASLPLVANQNTDTAASDAGGTADGDPDINELAKAIVYWRDIDADPDTAGFQPHGPFRSIYELNAVVDCRPQIEGGPDNTTAFEDRPGFRNGYGQINFVELGTTPQQFEPDDFAGDISPKNAPSEFTDAGPGYRKPDLTTAAINAGAHRRDLVRRDFEERNLNLIRISNMITTRSDSFVCYILLQGFRNAGTADPELVVQRRVALIIDRSGTTPANPTAKVTLVPNN